MPIGPANILCAGDVSCRKKPRASCWGLNQAIEESVGFGVMREPLFFLEKFAGVSLHVAARSTQGMLHMEHLMEEDVLDDERGDGFAVEAAIQDDLIQRRIKAAELPPPVRAAPAQTRTAQSSIKKAAIEAGKHRTEIEYLTHCATGNSAGAHAAQAIHTATRS
jgi:hypothetical protein